ncbi:MAG: GumC family protein [Terracidiphilus sp.]
MLGHRELTMQDYIQILKRRLWIILLSAAVFLGVGIGLTFIIPAKFVSQTLVIVQQQQVPKDYVEPVISENLNGRLASLQEQILSRSRLEPIIQRYSLFANGTNTMDDRVDLTRKAIKVAPIPSGENTMPGFYISFRAQNPRIAQQVCAEITSLFLSESIDAREQSAEGTTAFLQQQLADAKRTLDEQDAKLAGFQKKYLGGLPGQEQSNLNTLQALTTQLDAATQSLNRMQQDETFVQAVIAQQTDDLERAAPSSGGVPTDTLESQLKALIAQKQKLGTIYTPDYPDVEDLTHEIAEKQKEIALASAHPPSTKTAAASPGPDSPQLQQERAQLRGIRQSIITQKQEQARIAQQIRTYEARIESSPSVEEEYKEITRDHDTALQFYNSLLTKMNDSSMATDLERRQQGEQFQVLDAANFPEEPSFPNPRVFAGGGFAGGLCLGLLIVALLEYRNTTLRDERDVLAFTKLPTLAIISHINGLPKIPVQRKSRWALSRMNKAVNGANG